MTASEDLVERLKAAADDVALVREIIESKDSRFIAAAFTTLLSVDYSSIPNGSKCQKKVSVPSVRV